MRAQKIELWQGMSDFDYKIDQVHNESLTVQDKLIRTEEKFNMVMEAAQKMDEKVVKLESGLNAKLNNFIEIMKQDKTECNANADFCRTSISKSAQELNDIAIWRSGDVKSKFN